MEGGRTPSATTRKKAVLIGLTCEVTRAPNFQIVLQTSEEFCNKNIPVVFTTSTSNGGLQGDLDLLDL